jgi:NADH dehydrogenase
VVVGAGFGGLRVAHGLAGAPVDLLVIDQHNYHLFQPLLYQVSTAGLEPDSIAYPVRRILRRLPNADFQMARVDRVDLEGCQLITSMGAIGYDYLVLAAGGQNNFFGRDDLAQYCYGLKDLEQAVALRNHVLECFERAAETPSGEERTALLTFAIGGGGPTGVEFAGALAELVDLVLKRDYRSIEAAEVRLLLIEGGPDLLAMLHPSLRHATLANLRRKGVEVLLGKEIKGYDGERLELSDGTFLPTRTVMWAAGVKSVELASAAGIPTVRQGRLPVLPTLQLAGHPEVFVIGDMAYLEERGKPLPMVAPVAIQQGDAAAANILRQLCHEPAQPFVYRDKGSLATIGRNCAVAEVGSLRVTGFAAWVMWLSVHLIMLIGFRNRAVVLVNWTWNYFSYDRALRLITSPTTRQPKTGVESPPGAAGP